MLEKQIPTSFWPKTNMFGIQNDYGKIKQTFYSSKHLQVHKRNLSSTNQNNFDLLSFSIYGAFHPGFTFER